MAPRCGALGHAWRKTTYASPDIKIPAWAYDMLLVQCDRCTTQRVTFWDRQGNKGKPRYYRAPGYKGLQGRTRSELQHEIAIKIR